MPIPAAARDVDAPGLRFPPSFVWGVATSSYQIEGAVDADGRGDSIWDAFSRRPGAVARGESGDPACDHYHRWPQDVELLDQLGVDAYRLSIAWPRIQPEGRGPVNRKGIDFYRRVLSAVRDRGISPFVTMYHWDLPQALEETGGWRSRDTALRFADYAVALHDELGDLVENWITLNEPYVSSIVGYGQGRHAPGAREGHGALAAAHHLLLGHGLAVTALRDQARPDDRLGITLNRSPVVGVTDTAADIAAAARLDCVLNHQFSDPVLGAGYPAELTEIYAGVSDFSFRHDSDLATIAAPLDFLGLNYYYRIHVSDAPYAEPDPAARNADDLGSDRTHRPAEARRSGLNWPIEPAGLREVLTGLRDRHATLPPIYLTENGCAYPDPAAKGVPPEHTDEPTESAATASPASTTGVAGNDAPDDAERIDFLAEHLAVLREAIAAGIDVRGYFLWSLLDNFEWALGYGPRFGIVRVDYDTQQRTPRASFHWYRELLRAQRSGADTEVAESDPTG
ncbi:glycoside hydrolase family 1 protein [Actinoalloteichus hymeniacidonis]|uniref:Beta-glucosidase/6-phospho-beta-glucosidase/beta-galactosidase n=1 Tax=Actinoalloteichus hymeniacidonis TaxID=340345 RepID=A0AAC9HPK6_9PSEU|nr:family 1 glycosylhydrolase [Actinoalloteichus hymeniacidonis]AOS63039.1 beta-glucosidase/6-phospho-beta-glucosidase/beta-galactosidase [Actinoalloteichus hymeniacidonis]MBB5908926.1 beta-glucosidase [Actinoalloteichus hymeniacidonis]